MPRATPKITSRGRWQPKPKTAAPPPSLLTDLKDEHAPVRVGRLRPYLLGGAAILPLLAGLWIWLGMPTARTSVSPITSVSQRPTVGTPTIRSAHVVMAGDRGDLAVRTDMEDTGNKPMGTRFQWYVNDTPLPGQTAAILRAGIAKHGDRVMVEITPNNGTIDGAVFRTPVFLVDNAAPAILKLTVEPKMPRVGETLTVLAEVTDADRDEVTLSYRWSKNGTLIQDGPSHTLSPEGLARGDRIVVEVVPNDGRSEGPPARSVEMTIANGLPKITSTPTFSSEAGRLQYAVTAVDPDNDPLEFRLASGPSGMTIDKASGRLVWTPAPGARGPQRVRVEVHDDHEGVGSQEFDMTVPSAS